MTQNRKQYGRIAEEAQVEAIAEDAIKALHAAIYDTITVELAHREALAENIERDTLSNIEETQRMDTEADERDLADFIDRNKAAKRASDNRSVEMGE